MTLQLKLFGRLDVTDSVKALSVSLRPRAQRLLAYLLLNRRAATLARETVAFTLWPDAQQDEALGNLRRALSDLRAALPRLEGIEWMTATRDELRWNVAVPYALDIEDYQRLVQQGTPAALQAAVGRYAGDLLADWDEEWALAERERLRQMQLGALRELIAHHRALRQHETALGLVRQALALDPLAETLHRDLIALHYEAGDRAAALAAYDRLTGLLRDELDIAPMPETEALAAAIAQGLPLPVEVEVSLPLAQLAPDGRAAQAMPQMPHLIDRDWESAALRKEWEEAASGHGRLIIVSGEAGVGKTHLSTNLVDLVMRSGGLALVGYCYRFERALPYQAVIEMLRAAANLLRHADLAPAHRSALAHLAPDVLGAVGSPPAETPSADLRMQLFEALLQAFLTLAKSQPLLLLFEDVHAAAESTLDWLTYIAPRVSASRLLVVITCRTGEVGAEHGLSRLQRRFMREGVISSLALKPLSREANRELIGQLSGLNEAQAATVADCLFEDTSGNPFFLHELVRGLIEAGQINVVDGRWTGAFIESPPGAKLTLPDSLRATINARVARLTEMAASFLRAAAVAGKVFQYEIVRRAGGWMDELAMDALESALAHGFLRASEPTGSFAFAHHLVQEAIYADMTALRRAYWHHRLAEAIQAVRPHDIGALAYHFAQAAEHAQAANYFRQMAQRAMDMYAYADGLHALEAASHALDGLRLVPNVPLATVERESIEVLLDRAALIPSVGQPLEDHSRVLQAAADLLARHPDERLQANYCLRQAELLANQTQYERAAEAALGAYDCYLALGDRRGAAHGMELAGEYKITISQNKLGRSYLEQALALYREAGDEAGESLCLSDLAWCEMNLGEVASALPHITGALALSERRADKANLARAYYMLAMAWNYYHDADRLHEAAEKSLNLCREIGPGLMSRPLQFIADAHRMRGELDEAQATYERVFNETRTLHDTWVEGWASQALGRQALGRGDLQEAEQRLLHAYKLRLESGELQNQISDLTWLGRLRLMQGQARSALDHTSQAVTRLEPLLGEVYVWEMPDVFMGHAEALSANGDETSAAGFIQRAYDALMQFAAQITDPLVRQGYLAYTLNARIVAAWESADIQSRATQQTEGISSPTDVSQATQIAGEPMMAAKVEAPPVRPAVLAHRSRTNNLPIQLTTFIGRDREIATVKELLRGHRLLTLTGPGGCGKTRLALQVASERVGATQDGVWLVELASLSDPALVPQAVASVLGVHEQPGRALPDTLTGHLQSKELLLIFDNCEHVLDACAQLADRLLRACAGLRLLVTSRERLKVPGETVWPVPSLTLPSAQAAAESERLDDVPQSEAMLLFVDRAASVLPAFELNRHNAATIARICERLDGIPLAIELAAARVRLLTVAEIADRLDDAFTFSLLVGGSQLAPTRHQTLRATMDWSYRLLSEHEQSLFRRLAAFAGGCGLDAIEHICTDTGFEAQDVLEVLSQLIDKSLVVSDAHAEGPLRERKARYRLSAMIHQYAAMRLAECGEAATVWRRHGDYHTSLAEQAAAQIEAGVNVTQWLERLESEQDNFRAALQRALADGGAGREAGPAVRLATRLVDALRHYWLIRGYFTEGCRWLELALDLMPQGSTPGAARMKVLYALGNLSQMRSDFRRAQQCLEEALALSRALGDRTQAALALNGLGFLAINQQDCDRADPLLEEALSLFEALNHRRGAALAALNQGKCAFLRYDYARATERFERALSEFRALGNQYMVAFTLNDLGRVQFMTGDYARAESSFEKSLAMSRDLGSKASEMTAQLNLGYSAHVHMRYDRAAELFAESLRLSRELGARWAEAASLMRLGQATRRQNRLAEAVAHLEAALAIAHDLGDQWCIAECQDELAHVAMLQDRLAQAEDLLRHSLASFSQRGDKEALLWGMYSLAALALRRFDPEHATRLLGTIEARRADFGLPLSPLHRVEHDAVAASAKLKLSDAVFAARQAEGHALSLEQVVALTLSSD